MCPMRCSARPRTPVACRSRSIWTATASSRCLPDERADARRPSSRVRSGNWGSPRSSPARYRPKGAWNVLSARSRTGSRVDVVERANGALSVRHHVEASPRAWPRRPPAPCARPAPNWPVVPIMTASSPAAAPAERYPGLPMLPARKALWSTTPPAASMIRTNLGRPKPGLRVACSRSDGGVTLPSAMFVQVPVPGE